MFTSSARAGRTPGDNFRPRRFRPRRSLASPKLLSRIASDVAASIPSAGDVAAFDAAMTHAVRVGRLVASPPERSGADRARRRCDERRSPVIGWRTSLQAERTG